MNQQVVRDRLLTALKALVMEDGYMLEIGVGERAIVARVAAHLGPLFPDHSVDTEYNRHGIETKRAEIPPECASAIDDAGKSIIIPDLVVHKRSHDNDNLLVVEAKKSTDRRGSNCDRLRLDALKRELGYTYAALVEFPVRREAIELPKVQWV